MNQTFSKTIRGIKYIWNVDSLIEESREFEIKEVDMNDIPQLDEVIWFNNHKKKPTIRNTAEHMQRALKADLDFPIILAPDGSLMDGGHRIAKALLQGDKTIKAVQFEKYPKPQSSMEDGLLRMGKHAMPVTIDK